MAKRILVTGAEGFIGSHVAEHLIRQGYRVRALVLYNSFGSHGWLEESPEEIRDNLEIVLGDVRDPFAVREAVRGCDGVLHLAALIAIPYSYRAPDSYVDTNITGTLNVLQAVRDLQTPRLICTSTSEVYGTAQYVPIDEAHPLTAQSPYAATKIAADQLALSFYRSFETPVALLRPFNTYGPRQSARAVIPTIITQLLSGRRELHLGSLAPTRDFNYVGDIARAFAAALKAPEIDGQVINVGSQFEITIGDTVQAIMEVCGVEATIITDSQRLRPEKSEVERLFSDSRKAERLLDWQPEHGGLEGFRRGLDKTVAWFRNPAILSRYKAELYHV